MVLNFEKQGKFYVAEFVASRDFNIHLESGAPIHAVVYQKSVEDGKYSVASSINGVGLVLDTDFSAVVYPKYIRIESEYLVNNCHLTYA